MGYHSNGKLHYNWLVLSPALYKIGFDAIWHMQDTILQWMDVMLYVDSTILPLTGVIL